MKGKSEQTQAKWGIYATFFPHIKIFERTNQPAICLRISKQKGLAN